MAFKRSYLGDSDGKDHYDSFIEGLSIDELRYFVKLCLKSSEEFRQLLRRRRQANTGSHSQSDYERRLNELLSSFIPWDLCREYVSDLQLFVGELEWLAASDAQMAWTLASKWGRAGYRMAENADGEAWELTMFFPDLYKSILRIGEAAGIGAEDLVKFSFDCHEGLDKYGKSFLPELLISYWSVRQDWPDYESLLRKVTRRKAYKGSNFAERTKYFLKHQ